MAEKLSSYADFFEHDLAKIAVFTKQQQYPDRRICFDYQIACLKSGEMRHPAIIIENEAGYIATTFNIGNTDEIALWNVKRANDALSLTSTDINKIICSSMRSVPQ